MPICYTEALDRTFHALGDASRRQILGVLAQLGSASAGELVGRFEASQPTISRHIKVLEDAGLVSRERKGRHQVFALRGGALRDAESWIHRHVAFWDSSLDQLAQFLDEGEAAPQ